ncbi:MAG: GNAT family N-acetyltransferase [archaeon]
MANVTSASEGIGVSPDEIIIRQVRLADLHAAWIVEDRCYPPPEVASEEKFRKRIELFPEGFLVAELGGKIIGIINGATIEKEDISAEELKGMVGHVPGGKNVVVFTVAVLPEFRGLGVSRRLVERFVEISKGLGKEKVLLICKENMVDYYRKLGFVYTGKSASTHGGAEWHEMGMSFEDDAALVKKFLEKTNVYAVVGASANFRKYGHKIFKFLLAQGYEAYPVNPNAEKILERKCYPDLKSLPKKPDVVDIVVSPQVTEKIVRACKDAEIKKVWMQPSSESGEAIGFSKNNGIEVVHGKCVMAEISLRGQGLKAKTAF